MKLSLLGILVVSLLICILFLPTFADDKEMADLYFEVGIKALKKGNTEKAKEQFQKVLERYPTHTGAVVELGKFLAEEMDSAGLINLYREWLKALKSAGDPTQEQTKIAEKIKANLTILQELNKIDKRYSKKFAALAKSLKRKDESAAIEACEKALELDPGNSAVAREYKKLTGENRPAMDKTSKSKGPKFGELLASDNFSTPSHLWHQRDGNAWYEKGKFVVRANSGAPYSAGYDGNFQPENFCAEVEMQFIGKTKGGTGAGICFRSQSNSTFYMFMVSIEGKFGLWFINQGHKIDLTGKDKSLTTITCCVPSKYIKKGKAKNLIAVACVGPKIYCYVNNHLVFECEENTYKKGYLAHMVNMGNNNIYSFDNFKVREAFPADK